MNSGKQYTNLFDAYEADADLILQEEKCYLLTSQADEETIGGLLRILGENGSLETVLDVYDTRLYLFGK